MPLPRRFNAEDAEEALLQWADEVLHADLEKPIRKCVPVLTDDFEAHFLQSMGPTGKWAPRKDKKPHPLLIKTGKLIEAARDTGNPANIHTVVANELTIGVSSVVHYAGYQQDGTRNKDGSLRMVARPFIWVSDAALNQCEEKLAEACYILFVGG